MDAWVTWLIAGILTIAYFGIAALVARFIEPLPWRRRGPWVF